MWQKIKNDYLFVGAMVRFTSMTDGYNIATIVGIIDKEVWFARPYAYASADYSDKSGLVGVENFSIFLYRLVNVDDNGNDIPTDSDVEVYVDTKGKVRTMMVKAA